MFKLCGKYRVGCGARVVDICHPHNIESSMKKKNKFTDQAYMFALRKSICLMSTADLELVKNLIDTEFAKRNKQLKELPQ